MGVRAGVGRGGGGGGGEVRVRTTRRIGISLYISRLVHCFNRNTQVWHDGPTYTVKAVACTDDTRQWVQQ